MKNKFTHEQNMLNVEDCVDRSDNELVKLSLENQKYFYCIISRYEKVILYYILRISSFPREDAEDILQDVFISVYKNLNEFDNSLKFSSWIYRIAHNKTISAWRKIKVRPRAIPTDEEDNLFDFIASGENIVLELENKHTAQELRKSLEKLDEKYKEVLVLKFLEDKDYKEISDILKKPLGTIATLINRAKKKLKDEIMKNEKI
ncbi:MAG: RNA polymerase sigma-70 factor, ECF subfamily [Candidatus Moranbacteria bacterium GW2011_GWF2_34_56]|nr:MAG: RNA polymerase sigma-70 factor, ECF subfamily [Candidatus Moranbacteria bacterium GW2011_GWF1_34_10]KKP65051.1 MAG: RNA polymerase sigma-70 factor, ECF subfamily [Candidatus Moranbacteria bacterium GW2011_GWF2_34_56]